ncbi:MAG: hypothetical protein ACLU0O_09410 [Collinsella sp.]
MSTYLPYGADTLGIVGELLDRRERGHRGRAKPRKLPPVLHAAGERRGLPCASAATPPAVSAAWAIDKVEAPVE